MKVNKFGRAAILSPTQITLLFEEGFTKPRDRALFGVCLYAAARINEACTLLRGDVIGIRGVTRCLSDSQLQHEGEAVYQRNSGSSPNLRNILQSIINAIDGILDRYFFQGRHGRGSIHKASADKILRDVCLKLEIEGG